MPRSWPVSRPTWTRNGRLDPEERRRRAEHARSAYFTRLALASAAARRAKRASRMGGDSA